MVKVTARPRWNAEDDSRLQNLLSQGLTCPEIGRAMGRSPGAVTHRVRRLGISPNKSPVPWTAEEDRILAEMAKRRLTNQAIATRLGRTPTSVRVRRLKRGFDNEMAKWSPDRPVDPEYGDPFAGAKFEDAPVKKQSAVLSIAVSIPLRNNYMADM